MKILIVEDEPRAANRLERLIVELQPAATIVGKTPSVASTIQWLDNNATPDLVFMDVRLEDGDSFEILAKRSIESPIVFCTAFGGYALQAFAANSIDYLLKPIVRIDLTRALRKYQKFTGFRMSSNEWPDFPAESAAASGRKNFRQQFLVAVAGHFSPVRTADVIAVGSYLKGCQLIDRSGRQWVLDDSLADVEGVLNPDDFCRVSRQWLVRLSAVVSLVRSDGRYKLDLAGLTDPVTVSRARVREIKARLAD
jgi:DNA-binding LytR/AlgR family response regulator